MHKVTQHPKPWRRLPARFFFPSWRAWDARDWWSILSSVTSADFLPPPPFLHFFFQLQRPESLSPPPLSRPALLLQLQDKDTSNTSHSRDDNLPARPPPLDSVSTSQVRLGRHGGSHGKACPASVGRRRCFCRLWWVSLRHLFFGPVCTWLLQVVFIIGSHKNESSDHVQTARFWIEIRILCWLALSSCLSLDVL